MSENNIMEIFKLLEDGPEIGKETLFIQTLELILCLTDDEENLHYFSPDNFMIVLKYFGHKSPYNTVVYKILINLFSKEELSLQLCKKRNVMDCIITTSVNDIYSCSKDADYCCMLLSNVTRSKSLQVLNHFNPLIEHLQKMINLFTTINCNVECTLDHLSMILCNLSQISEVRTIFTRTDKLLLQKLVPFLSHESIIRRKGIIGLVRNCSFDSSIHDWMLSREVDILPHLLLPLAGPEQFDDEDNDKLPIDLQYLPDTKAREPDAEIRKQLLETLNQLCTTKSGRQYLRDHNTYIILRELHKWEEHSDVLFACENVVNILIRTEDEIGFENFNTIEIPTDLEEKFNKDLAM